PVYLNADPTRLAQIVGNLLNNACKFSDRGGHIWLTVERTEEPDGDSMIASCGLPPNVVIRVRDTGIGIAANQQSRIFDMLTQGDTALARSATAVCATPSAASPPINSPASSTCSRKGIRLSSGQRLGSV